MQEPAIDIEALIVQELDQQKDNDQRIAKIDDLLHLLNFESRLARLTEHQRQDMLSAGEAKITDEMRKKLDACKNETDRESMLYGYGRAAYFRQCHWTDYLNGVSNMPPVAATPDNANTASTAI